jgi:hypothetical protein
MWTAVTDLMAIRRPLIAIVLGSLGWAGCTNCGEGLFANKDDCDTGDTGFDDAAFGEGTELSVTIAWEETCTLTITVENAPHGGLNLGMAGESWTGEACDFDDSGRRYCKSVYNGMSTFESVNDGYAGATPCGGGLDELDAHPPGRTIYTGELDVTYAFFTMEGELKHCQGSNCAFFGG